jgi:F-box domain
MDIDATIPKAAAKYNHPWGTSFRGNGWLQSKSPDFIGNIDCIMKSLGFLEAHSIVPIPRSSLGGKDPTKNSARHLRSALQDALLNPSIFEDIPYEIMLTVLSYLDMASLVRLADTNARMKNLVLSIPKLAFIRANPILCHAFSRMLVAGSGQYFTLEEFVRQLASPICGTCKSEAHFAPYLCLVSCSRVCESCLYRDEQLIHVPIEMAVMSLDLKFSDLSEQGGMAVARLPSDLASRGEVSDCHRIRVAVTSFSRAVAKAERQHQTIGGIAHVKKLLTQYVTDSATGLYGTTATNIAAGHQVMGLVQAVKKEWVAKGLNSYDLTRSFLTSVPYMEVQSFPPTLKHVYTCEGCHRWHRNNPPFCAREWINIILPKLYLKDQIERHVMRCSTAQQIVRGERLTTLEEWKLRDPVERKASEYWPEKNYPPEISTLMALASVDKTPDEVRAWASNTMRLVITLGEKEKDSSSI